jgi:cell division protein FtsI/penicillin-binding protein 2
MKKFQIKKWIENKLKNNKNLLDFIQRPEFIIFAIFCLLFFILVLRLFFVQIIHHKKYEEVLNNQHFTQSSLQADR